MQGLCSHQRTIISKTNFHSTRGPSQYNLKKEKYRYRGEVGEICSAKQVHHGNGHQNTQVAFHGKRQCVLLCCLQSRGNFNDLVTWVTTKLWYTQLKDMLQPSRSKCGTSSGIGIIWELVSNTGFVSSTLNPLIHYQHFYKISNMLTVC